MSLGKVAGGNEIDTNLRVLKAWSPIQTSSSSDRLTHSSKHTQHESDGTEKFADLYCSVTEAQEFTQKKKKVLQEIWDLCPSTSPGCPSRDQWEQFERLFTDAGASSENTE